MSAIDRRKSSGYGDKLKDDLLRTGLTIPECSYACGCSSAFVYSIFRELNGLNSFERAISHLIVRTMKVENDRPRSFVYFLIRWADFREEARRFERASRADFRNIVKFLYKSIFEDEDNLNLLLATMRPLARTAILEAFPDLGSGILRAIDGSENSVKQLISTLGYQNKGVMHLMRQLQRYHFNKQIERM